MFAFIDDSFEPSCRLNAVQYLNYDSIKWSSYYTYKCQLYLRAHGPCAFSSISRLHLGNFEGGLHPLSLLYHNTLFASASLCIPYPIPTFCTFLSLFSGSFSEQEERFAGPYASVALRGRRAVVEVWGRKDVHSKHCTWCKIV